MKSSGAFTRQNRFTRSLFFFLFFLDGHHSTGLLSFFLSMDEMEDYEEEISSREIRRHLEHEDDIRDLPSSCFTDV